MAIQKSAYASYIIPALFTLIAIALALNINPGTSNGITASGEHTINTQPDEAYAYIRIETSSPSPADAQQENAEATNRVIDALEVLDLGDEKIETSHYAIYQKYNYDPETFEQTPGDYIASQALSVKTSKFDRIGEVVDTAVENGATGIDNIEFSLSDSKRKLLEADAIGVAIASAEAEAQSIAKSLKVRLGKPVKVDTFISSPFYRLDSSEALSTIPPREAELTVSVIVVYGIK